MLVKIIKICVLVVFGYFVGCFSSARFLSKIKKDDITKHGSGNPGTMNMLRTYGIKLGALTLVLDVLKGALPSLIGFFMFKGTGTSAYVGLFMGGISAVFGHVFPIFNKFKGGKGVACVVGMFAVAEPIWALVMFLVCFVYLLLFKYGALASFIFITVLTIIEGNKFRGNIIICMLLFGVFFLTWFLHRQNFFRLLIGKENKVNLFKKKKQKINRREKKEIKQKEIG